MHVTNTASGKLTKAEGDALLGDTRASLLALKPAYGRVIAWAQSEMGAAPSGRVGAISLPGGAEWYAAALNLNTTLDLTADQERVVRDLYQAKLEKDANKYIHEFDSGIKVVNGPYGPYVTDGSKNAKITKGTDPKSLTEEDCKKLLEAAPARKKPAFRRRKDA